MSEDEMKMWGAGIAVGITLICMAMTPGKPIACNPSENGTTGATSWHTPAGFDCEPTTSQVDSYRRSLWCDPNNDYATPGQIIPECKNNGCVVDTSTGECK